MLKRTLFFGSSGKLSIDMNLLLYESMSDDGKFTKRTFPLEDIGFIVLESRQLNISSYCLSELAENNIVLLVCDSSHMPNGTLLPFSAHSLTQKHTEAQINASDALKERLWKQTVQAKLNNQAQCLAKLGLPFEKLAAISKTVKKGDAENAEAVGARCYFKTLSPDSGFLREQSGVPPNNALNYGYAILRAALARGLAGSGLLCIAGIHHANQYNPYGLADDIMEPYRPFIDELVFSEKSFFSSSELTKAHKAKLLQALAMDVMIEENRRPLMNAISYTTASLVRCFTKESNTISYPEFVQHATGI